MMGSDATRDGGWESQAIGQYKHDTIGQNGRDAETESMRAPSSHKRVCQPRLQE